MCSRGNWSFNIAVNDSDAKNFACCCCVFIVSGTQCKRPSVCLRYLLYKILPQAKVDPYTPYGSINARLNGHIFNLRKGPFTLVVSVNAATTPTSQINLGFQPIFGATGLVYRSKEICKQLIRALLLA